jgi:hypothetical protein
MAANASPDSPTDSASQSTSTNQYQITHCFEITPIPVTSVPNFLFYLPYA